MAADGAIDVPGMCPAHAPYTEKQGQYLAFIYYYT